MVRWFLSLHSPSHSYTLSPQKLSGAATPKAQTEQTPKPDPGELSGLDDGQESQGANGSSVVPGTSNSAEDLPSIPPAFTPSIKKTLEKVSGKPIPLPAGMNVGLLKSRLEGKKVKSVSAIFSYAASNYVPRTGVHS